MNVWGYDPAMTVHNAWQLNSGVRQALSVDDLVSKSQFISVHVPLLDATRGLINRSEKRRVGKECVSTCRFRWSPYHEKKMCTKRVTIHRTKKSNKMPNR